MGAIWGDWKVQRESRGNNNEDSEAIKGALVGGSDH